MPNNIIHIFTAFGNPEDIQDMRIVLAHYIDLKRSSQRSRNEEPSARCFVNGY